MKRFVLLAMLAAALPAAPASAEVDGRWNETWTSGMVGVATLQGSAGLPYTLCGYGIVVYRDLSGTSIPPHCATHTVDMSDARALTYVDVNVGRHEVDGRPGVFLPVETPYGVPGLLEAVCEATPEWSRPCVI